MPGPPRNPGPRRPFGAPRRAADPGAAGGDGGPALAEGTRDEVSVDELREFLEADWLGSQADPKFRERLRRKLWEWLRLRYGGGSPPTP